MAEFGGSQIEVQKTVLKTYEQVVFFFFLSESCFLLTLDRSAFVRGHNT